VTNPWASASAGVDARVPHHPPVHYAVTSSNPFSTAGAGVNGAAYPSMAVAGAHSHAQQRTQAFQHGRSHSIDTGDLALHPSQWPRGAHQAHHQQQQQQQQQQQRPTLMAMANPGVGHNGAAAAAAGASSSSGPWPSSSTAVREPGGVDPFDVAWAAKAVNKNPPSPFSSPPGKQLKQFEVQL
jgi:hypothetical protein